MTPTQARLLAERKARLSRMEAASLAHFDRCYDEAQARLPKPAPMPMPEPKKQPKLKPAEIKNLPTPMQLRHRVLAIQEAVCERYNIEWSDLIGQSRQRAFSKPRQLAMYLARDLTNMSFPQIGDRFGGKDHTSVIHACQQVRRQMEANPEFAAVVEAIRQGVEG